MKKLSPAQVAMLKSIKHRQTPYGHLRGRSAIGGGTRTLTSLYRLGLIDRNAPGIVLSAAGENALSAEEVRAAWENDSTSD